MLQPLCAIEMIFIVYCIYCVNLQLYYVISLRYNINNVLRKAYEHLPVHKKRGKAHSKPTHPAPVEEGGDGV